MFRIWFKIMKNNHMVRDTVIEDNSAETRTHKVFHALEAACYEFDLSRPVWLNKTVRDFQMHAKARFYQDNFMETIDFDYMEVQVIEE